MMNGQRESDGFIVPSKLPNKSEESEAEAMEGRGLAKGNADQQNANRTLNRKEPAPSALDRVRKKADTRFRLHLRQEPSAVMPHAGDLHGGLRVTGVPTVTIRKRGLASIYDGSEMGDGAKHSPTTFSFVSRPFRRYRDPLVFNFCPDPSL